MNGPLKFWGGVALTLILVALFILTVDIHRMVDALVKANYWFLLPGIALYIIAVLFRTLRWQLLLHHIKPISVWRFHCDLSRQHYAKESLHPYFLHSDWLL